MTDYQSRRLNTRVRREGGEVELVHTNDATAFALGRIMIAVIENYQNEDMTIRVPEVLRKYMDGKETI
jgi:seryl-tRNA synthetase